MATAAADERASVRPMTKRQRAGTIAGFSAAVILAVAFVFHLYWALGGDWAAATAYGSTELPPQEIVAVVSVLIAAAAVLVLRRIGAVAAPLPGWIVRGGPWLLVLAFGLAGVGNVLAPEGSYARDWHLFFFGPLLLGVAILCAFVARAPMQGDWRSRG